MNAHTAFLQSINAARVDTPVWLDSTAEDERSSNPQLALQAHHIHGTWNGHPIPVATAAELDRFVTAHSANDEGAWDCIVKPFNDCIVLEFFDGGSDTWFRAKGISTDLEGNALYALDGWTWTR